MKEIRFSLFMGFLAGLIVGAWMKDAVWGLSVGLVVTGIVFAAKNAGNKNRGTKQVGNSQHQRRVAQKPTSITKRTPRRMPTA